jgi:hypothetical protein
MVPGRVGAGVEWSWVGTLASPLVEWSVALGGVELGGDACVALGGGATCESLDTVP